MESVREQALVFGERKSLIGILAIPGTASPGSAVPTIVILNAGIIHRVGPSRLHVELARSMAAQGFPVLRFDLSGIGDSAKRQDTLPPAEAAMADVRAALDHLEASGRTRGVILAGLCDGANYALMSGAVDRRVVGLILLDPYVPKTVGFHLRHYGSRVFRFQSWLNFTSGRHPLWRSLMNRLVRRPAAEPVEIGPLALSNREVHAHLERAYLAGVERGAPLLGVFTAGLEGQHNYRGQLLDAFPRVPFGSLLRLEHFPQSDHTFTSEAERARLTRLVLEWARSTTFPLPPTVPAVGLLLPAATAIANLKEYLCLCG